MKTLKNFVLTALVMACSTILCQANPLTNLSVIKGEIPVFKNGQTVKLVTNFSNTTWDEDTPMKSFWIEEYRENYLEDELDEAYEEFLTLLHDAFVTGFKEGRFPLQSVDEDADYTVSVTIRNFHDARDMWHRTTIAYGLVDIIDNATGKMVCRLKIDRLKGKESNDKTNGTIDCMKRVGKSVSLKMRKSKD